MIELEVPCFFYITGIGINRTHVGHPLVHPSVNAQGTSAEQATWRLYKALREHIKAAGTPILEEFSAIPANAEETTYLLTMPVAHRPDATETEGVGRNARGRMEIRTPAVTFRIGRHPFVCLPRVQGQIFALPADTEPAGIPNALQTVVDAWFRTNREHFSENPIYAQDIAEAKGDRLLWLKLSIQPPHTAFEETREVSLKTSLGGWGAVNGAVELGRVSRCLNDRYPDGLLLDLEPDPRVELIRYNVFVDPTPTPIALVGPPGIGKTTLVHAAIRRHLESCSGPNIPTHQGPHHQPHLYHLDPNRVIAGMSIVGAWERRMVAILQHLVDPDRKRPRDGLYIDNPLALARVGKSAGSNLTLTTILRSWAEQKRIPLLIEATPESWRRLEELDRSFADLFQVVRIDPPDQHRALRMVLSQVEGIEQKSGVSLDISAIRRSFELEQRFPGTRMLPGGLVDRLELLATRFGNQFVDETNVDKIFEQTSGLRKEIFDTIQPLKDEDLKKSIRSRLVGQDQAVDVLAEGIHVLRAGLARPGKPLACWLLVGPTGVGKTEAAKVLTDTIFISPDRLIRLDMNEYVDAGGVSRLIGDGTTEGLLTGAVRSQPLAVLLLDEIEKAHPLVHDLLLQLLDEGRLTDARGIRADFQKVFVILTSNVGAQEIARTSGFERSGKAENATWVSAVTRHFRPELVNRLDRVVVFHPLTLPHIHRIARLQIERILLREGFLRRTVLLDIHPDAIDKLARLGFDPVLGARALKRVLEAELIGSVSSLIATLKVDQPVRLQILPGTTSTLETSIFTLQFIEPVQTHPTPPISTAAQAAHLLDRLPQRSFRFEAGPDGVHVEGEDILAIQRILKEILDSFQERVQSVELEDRHVAHIATKGRRLRYRNNPWKPGRIDWTAAVSFRSIREFLSEGQSFTDSWLDVEEGSDLGADLSLAILETQIEALRESHSETVWVHIRPIIEDTDIWANFHDYLRAFRHAIGLVSGTLEEFVLHPKRGWVNDSERNEKNITERAWKVDGPAIFSLIKQEHGIHLAYPDNRPPTGLTVQVLVSPHLTPHPPPIEPGMSILRLYITESQHTPGKIEDLREGVSVDKNTLQSLLPRWWWQNAKRELA